MLHLDRIEHRPGLRRGIEERSIAERLHRQDAHIALLRGRDHELGETPIVRVKNVDRHLHGVEGEIVTVGHVEHVQMELRILVTRESR